jgi:hypothetical protein
VHAQFADAYGTFEVMRSELDLADRLHSFADAIERGDHTIPDDLGVRREAFSCAAWLQELHPIMQEVIAEREGKGNAHPGRSDRGVSPNDGLARALAASNRAFLWRC